MNNSSTKAARKAMAGLAKFLARGMAAETPTRSVDPASRCLLVREDGARRQVDRAVLALALSSGLTDHPAVHGKTGSAAKYRLTKAGHAALKRWLSDPDSAFQNQHRVVATRGDPDHGALAINLAESPLAALSRVKGRDGAPFLAPELLAAGERLRVDFTRGQLAPSMGHRWDLARAGRPSAATNGAGDLTDAAMAARQRVEGAISAVGPDLSGVLLDACCFLKGLTLIERERQWPARSAKLMLRAALQALERHYAAPKRRASRQAARAHGATSGQDDDMVRPPHGRQPHAP